MEQMELDSDETAVHCNVVVTDTHFGIHPFYIRRGTHMNISWFVLVATSLMWPEVAHVILQHLLSAPKIKRKLSLYLVMYLHTKP
jgi:hypothetical protein